MSETTNTVRFNQTLPKVWVDEIQKLVKSGYCKNIQAFVEEAVREKVLPLLQVEKKKDGEN